MDQVNDPTSFTAQAMVDLNDRPPASSLAPFEKVRPKIDDESDNDCEDVVCKDCFGCKAQVQNLKDNVAELYKEILKIRRQKRLITESYELEIAELNKRIKNNEPKQRYNSSGINIIINSEGQSVSKSK